MLKWKSQSQVSEATVSVATYDLPFGMDKIRRSVTWFALWSGLCVMAGASRCVRDVCRIFKERFSPNG